MSRNMGTGPRTTLLEWFLIIALFAVVVTATYQLCIAPRAALQSGGE